MSRTSMVLKGFIILGLLGGLLLPAGQKASAETVHTYKDETSSFAINGSSVRMTGEHVVWRENGQIRYGNTSTGQKTVITNHGKSTDSPAIGINGSGEAVVVWADKRNQSEGTGNLNWDIYSYNLSTNTEKKLNDTVGQHRIPSIDGNYIVWQTNPDYEMHVYDMTAGVLTNLGLGRDPIVGNGRIVYKGAADGSLYEYDIAARTHEKILDLPYSQYVERFVFNGEEILWKQRDMDGYGKYTFMDLGENNPQPVDLTEPVIQGVEYKEMSITDGMAVWLEASGGSVVMKGADLTGGSSYTLGVTKPSQFIGFNGDGLVLVNNGKLVNRTIIQTEAGLSNNRDDGQNTGGTVIGLDGGIVSADDQAASLKFEQGTFNADTRIVLEKSTETALFDSKPAQGMTWAGMAWNWTADAELKKPAMLTFELEQALDSADLANRIGIYRYIESDGKWIYAGGMVDSAWSKVHAQVVTEGLYALFTYTPSFSDMKGHWAQSEVEVLASRWIVNGMQTGNFEPKQSVTRAQFAKMLVETAGLGTGQAGGGSFRDVPDGHWAARWIGQAAAAGWIKGYEGSLFKPNAAVTREEMMVMLANAARLGKEDTSDTLSGYADADRVREWAKPSVEAAIKSGIIQGNGGFLNPGGTSTRVEAAAVIYRWLAMKGEVFNG
ncbi:S-layer family protein [Paenibacillus prosopidis]|uniref:S-layer family protein n=2 Tax=Paenibacillus prosopidis TaxID=630520 RepID=A0A368W6L1_9BACL|nr:S-layer family protein [Paenibacillus prosopidis]